MFYGAVIFRKRADIDVIAGRLARFSAGRTGWRVMLVLLFLSGAVAGLSLYAAVGVGNAGRLVADAFDQSLVSSDYAQRVATDFVGMQTALVHKRLSRSAERAEVTRALAATASNDLRIAAERSLSAQARSNANQAAAAVNAWLVAQAGSIGRRDEMGSWAEMDRLSSQVSARIDRLVSTSEEDGIAQRQSALATIENAARYAAAAASAALILTIAIIALLVQWMTSASRSVGTGRIAGAETGSGPAGNALQVERKDETTISPPSNETQEAEWPDDWRTMAKHAGEQGQAARHERVGINVRPDRDLEEVDPSWSA